MLPPDRPIEVNLGGSGLGSPEALSASIPGDYVADPEIRMNLYARLARMRDLAAIDDFSEEIEDRFGRAA